MNAATIRPKPDCSVTPSRNGLSVTSARSFALASIPGALPSFGLRGFAEVWGRYTRRTKSASGLVTLVAQNLSISRAISACTALVMYLEAICSRASCHLVSPKNTQQVGGLTSVLHRQVEHIAFIPRLQSPAKITSGMFGWFRPARIVPVRHQYFYGESGGRRADDKEILIVGRAA